MGAGEVLAAMTAVVAGCMIALWLLSLALRDASIVDIFWGLGFCVIAVTSYTLSDDTGSGRALLRVSGVPMLERSIHKRRPDYRAYRARTSAFFPRPPAAA